MQPAIHLLLDFIFIISPSISIIKTSSSNSVLVLGSYSYCFLYSLIPSNVVLQSYRCCRHHCSLFFFLSSSLLLASVLTSSTPTNQHTRYLPTVLYCCFSLLLFFSSFLSICLSTYLSYPLLPCCCHHCCGSSSHHCGVGTPTPISSLSNVEGSADWVLYPYNISCLSQVENYDKPYYCINCIKVCMYVRHLVPDNLLHTLVLLYVCVLMFFENASRLVTFLFERVKLVSVGGRACPVDGWVLFRTSIFVFPPSLHSPPQLTGGHSFSVKVIGEYTLVFKLFWDVSVNMFEKCVLCACRASPFLSLFLSLSFSLSLSLSLSLSDLCNEVYLLSFPFVVLSFFPFIVLSFLPNRKEKKYNNSFYPFIVILLAFLYFFLLSFLSFL
ncbi:unnamed protein product [Acanthosepion pharaonis]|uniref:Uncharacterized protein n=1 Tax=Acanthosepion pharaonis TaxID=158019 RepID=A0A812ELL0_ACAPH|nr:unnamed protein product [Sepia pharaonis]